MNIPATDSNVTKANIVWPFYAYATVAFFVACLMLSFNSTLLLGHYFQPILLSITHTMALAWGSMVIFGATLQLLPVLTGKAIKEVKLAKFIFYLTSFSIPFLIYGFYHFVFGYVFFISAILFIVGIIFLVWVVFQNAKSSELIQVDYVLSASIYLLITILLGFLLALNFSYSVLPESSLHYLKLHAHLGIIGWFLFLIIGVGSKLIPMFFISKYENQKLLKLIYYILHISLLIFITSQTFINEKMLLYISIIGIIISILMFIYFIWNSYKMRIKKHIDLAMRVAPFSKMMLLLGIGLLLFSFVLNDISIVVSYGFVVFFGWISLLILGMTFKTLPFIIWNDKFANSRDIKNPKDLYSAILLKIMLMIYIIGVVLTILGVLLKIKLIVLASTYLLSIGALLYSINVFKILFLTPKHVRE